MTQLVIKWGKKDVVILGERLKRAAWQGYLGQCFSNHCVDRYSGNLVKMQILAVGLESGPGILHF